MSQGVVSFFICFHVIFFTSLVPTMCPKTPLHYQNFLFMPVPDFLDAEPLTKKLVFGLHLIAIWAAGANIDVVLIYIR